MSRNSPGTSLKNHIHVSQNYGNQKMSSFSLFWKRWGPTNPEDPFNMTPAQDPKQSIPPPTHAPLPQSPPPPHPPTGGGTTPRQLRGSARGTKVCLANTVRTPTSQALFGEKSWKSWTWDQYLPENMNGIFVVWYQYLPESMKCNFGKMEFFSSNKILTVNVGTGKNE